MSETTDSRTANRVDGMGPAPASMAQHIERVADFIDARIEELFSGEHINRNWDSDPVSRALRALRRGVEEIRAKHSLAAGPFADHQQRDLVGMQQMINISLTYAWGELASMAKQWNDHPDYLADFALLAHQLPDIPAANEAP
ncbi:hypothetical protein [Streptomyces sp. NPDC007074]|uniref:hypothetical protein n=1 Tax=Streptomyces sp. NPDC007074 TaxID=3156764 RepID=UPI0033CCA97B